VDVSTGSRISTQWIVSPGYDLTWFIGAALSGFIYLYLVVGLNISIVVLWWMFTCFFDAPHLFATYVRTYFDRIERRERKALLIGSLLWFLLGPACVAGSVFFGNRIFFDMFVAFLLPYGWWHIFRQHYGFLALYQKKNHEPSGYENKFDYFLFHLVMLAPFLVITLTNITMRRRLGLGLLMSPGENLIVDIFIGLTLSAAMLFVMKEIYRLFSGERVNLPKNLFFLASVSLPITLCLLPAAKYSDPLTLVAIVTIFHNIQYHGIVWFYSRTRYHSGKQGVNQGSNELNDKKYGLASRITTRVLGYLGVCIALAILWNYWGWLLIGSSVIPFTPEPTVLSTVQFGSGVRMGLRELAYTIAVSISLQHYYLDQKIWKVSRDKGLRSDLRLTADE